MIINERLASFISQDKDVIGKRIYWQGRPDPYEVIGVVNDIVVPNSGNSPRIFVTRTSGFNFQVKLNENQSIDRTQVSSVIQSVNRSFYIYDYIDLEGQLNELLATDRTVIVISMGIGLITLFLASLGIYGVFNYSVMLRRYELGVRMAIGGKPNDINQLIFNVFSLPIGVGLAIGMVLSIIGAMYYVQNVSEQLPVTVLATILAYVIVLVTSAVACWLPLFKIVKKQPISSLRG